MNQWGAEMTRMSIEICILASGSGGNCTVVRTPSGVVLIDAGLGPLSAARRMEGTGIHVRQLSAICLTHLDHDHFTPTWVRTLLRLGIRVFCHASRVDELMERVDHHPQAREFGELIETFDGHAFEALSNLHLHPIQLAHDRAGSHGFVIEGFGCRIGYATDLGRVPAGLLQHFNDLDILAIESNYDPQMQLDSSRPWFLKNRIMGGAGHLSNRQAFDAVVRILNRAEKRGRLPQHIVLLHRSLECNCPKLVRKFFARDARIAQRLTLAEQFERTSWLRSSESPNRIGQQLSLAWG
jgi:phosphoribosyl 1,2-cyclic phosphodiesterase